MVESWVASGGEPCPLGLSLWWREENNYSPPTEVGEHSGGCHGIPSFGIHLDAGAEMEEELVQGCQAAHGVTLSTQTGDFRVSLSQQEPVALLARLWQLQTWRAQG